MAADASSTAQGSQPADPSATTAASNLLLVLQELQASLQQSSSSGSNVSFSTPAAADAQLAQLRRCATALQQHIQHRLQLQSPDSHAAVQAVTGCVERLTGVLLQPPVDLYSGLSGAPCHPPEGLELAGEQQQLLAAAQLQLLALLLGLFDAVKLLGAAADAEQPPQSQPAQDRARNRPTYFEGIVEIQELPADDTPSNQPPHRQLQQQLQQQLIQVLLVAALYAPDSSSSSSSSSGGESRQKPAGPSEVGPSASNSSSGQQSLDCFCDGIVQQGLQLHTPWSGPACQQQAQQLVQQLVLAAGALPDHSSTSSSRRQANGVAIAAQELPTHSTVGDDGSNMQQQQQQVWCQLLPLLLDQLRDTLLAQHRHGKLQGKGDMVTYTGPSPFQRCLAARQLAWLVQQLQPPSLTDPQTLGLLLPLVLAVADDHSPSVRQYGHAALGWLGYSSSSSSSSSSRSAGIQWQGALLREEARRLVVGCEESCWPTAMPAATSLILALEGCDQRSTAYHGLMLELLTEAERTAHKPQPRLVFMSCVARLAPNLGLYVVRHLAALMPLLLEWVHAYDEHSSVVALQLLALLVRCAWPRMGVHAGVVRAHVEQVLGQERVEQGRRHNHQQQKEEQGEEGVLGQEGSVGSRRFLAAQQLLAQLDGLSCA